MWLLPRMTLVVLLSAFVAGSSYSPDLTRTITRHWGAFYPSAFEAACRRTSDAPVLLLVRTPETVSDKGAVPGASVPYDVALTGTGELQVPPTVNYLQTYLEAADATADIISSPLSCAQAIAGTLEASSPRVARHLVEAVVGQYDEAKYGPVAREFARYGVRAHAGPADWLDDVELQLQGIQQRMAMLHRGWLADGKRRVLIVVGQSEWLSAALQHLVAKGRGGGGVAGFHLCGSGITGLAYHSEESTWEVLGINSVAHLPPALVTGARFPNFRRE